MCRRLPLLAAEVERARALMSAQTGATPVMPAA